MNAMILLILDRNIKATSLPISSYVDENGVSDKKWDKLNLIRNIVISVRTRI